MNDCAIAGRDRKLTVAGGLRKTNRVGLSKVRRMALAAAAALPMAFSPAMASTLWGQFTWDGANWAQGAPSGQSTYSYDALGRLTGMTDNQGNSFSYTYDAAGNRKQVVQNSAANPIGQQNSFNTTIQVTGSAPVNLRSLANAAGYNGAENATIEFQVASGVTITGGGGNGAAGGVAVDSGTWPGGYVLTVTLHVLSGGVIRGGGGGGGVGGGSPNPAGASGFAGGNAIECHVPMAVTVDSGGVVQGGAGGGGGGGLSSGGYGSNYGGGGGGGGFPNGSGGLGGTGTMIAAGGNGGAGSTSAGGSGGSPYSGSGYGGDGGGAGSAGGSGSSGSSGAGGPGGAAGFAIHMNGNSVTVTNNGTISGAQG